MDHLLKHGTDVNTMNTHQHTPLVTHITMMKEKNPAVTRLLLPNGSVPNLQLPDGPTLVQVAEQRGLFAIARVETPQRAPKPRSSRLVMSVAATT